MEHQHPEGMSETQYISSFLDKLSNFSPCATTAWWFSFPIRAWWTAMPNLPHARAHAVWHQRIGCILQQMWFRVSHRAWARCGACACAGEGSFQLGTPAWFRLCTTPSTVATRLAWRIWRLIRPAFASPTSRSTPIAGYPKRCRGVVLITSKRKVRMFFVRHNCFYN